MPAYYTIFAQNFNTKKSRKNPAFFESRVLVALNERYIKGEV